MKIRNAISHLLDFPLAFDPDKSVITKQDYFLILDIDFEYHEITLVGVLMEPGIPVVVELNDSMKTHINELNLKEKHTIFAVIASQPSEIGITEEWNFINLWRVDNFSEIFHDLHNQIEDE